LDNHIATLASEVTAFQSERNLIAHHVAKERQVYSYIQTSLLINLPLQDVYYSAKVDHNEFERVLLIEEECIRRVILVVIEVAEH